MYRFAADLVVPAAGAGGDAVATSNVAGSKWVSITGISGDVLRVEGRNKVTAGDQAWTPMGTTISADTVAFEVAADVDEIRLYRVSGSTSGIKAAVRGWFGSP